MEKLEIGDLKIGDHITVEWIDDDSLSTNHRTQSSGWVMGLNPLEVTPVKYISADGLVGEPQTIHRDAVWSIRLLDRLELPPEVQKPDFLEGFDDDVEITLSNGETIHGYRFTDGRVYYSVDGKWFLAA